MTHTAAVGLSGAIAEFTAAVENYDRFMGRYATGLAPKFADAAGVRAGMRVLDVGCGPGALAVELAARVGEMIGGEGPMPRMFSFADPDGNNVWVVQSAPAG